MKDNQSQKEISQYQNLKESVEKRKNKLKDYLGIKEQDFVKSAYFESMKPIRENGKYQELIKDVNEKIKTANKEGVNNMYKISKDFGDSFNKIGKVADENYRRFEDLADVITELIGYGGLGNPNVYEGAKSNLVKYLMDGAKA